MNKKTGKFDNRTRPARGQKRGAGRVVYSAEKEADPVPQIQTRDFGGTDEVHLKFFVHHVPGKIPSACQRHQVSNEELAKRAIHHNLAPGDNFIKDAFAVSAQGIGDKLVEAGYRLSTFSYHVKETLHQRNVRAVIEIVFTKGAILGWNDSLLEMIRDRSWIVHIWKNPSGIMTINMTHPQRRDAERYVVIEDGKITVKSIND